MHTSFTYHTDTVCQFGTLMRFSPFLHIRSIRKHYFSVGFRSSHWKLSLFRCLCCSQFLLTCFALSFTLSLPFRVVWFEEPETLCALFPFTNIQRSSEEWEKNMCTHVMHISCTHLWFGLVIRLIRHIDAHSVFQRSNYQPKVRWSGIVQVFFLNERFYNAPHFMTTIQLGEKNINSSDLLVVVICG